jgi:hypothetical protein
VPAAFEDGDPRYRLEVERKQLLSDLLGENDVGLRQIGDR